MKHIFLNDYSLKKWFLKGHITKMNSYNSFIKSIALSLSHSLSCFIYCRFQYQCDGISWEVQAKWASETSCVLPSDLSMCHLLLNASACETAMLINFKWAHSWNVRFSTVFHVNSSLPRLVKKVFITYFVNVKLCSCACLTKVSLYAVVYISL